MNQENKEFYGIYADKLDEVCDFLFHEIQAMLDSISTDSAPKMSFLY